MASPDAPPPGKAIVVMHEIRSLRDTRALLLKNSLIDVSTFVSANPHPRLWRLLFETALDRLDLTMAIKAAVASRDYGGVQFVKKLKRLAEPTKQRAEIAVFFKRYDEAETLYARMDRADLALDMRARIGDWQAVLAALTSSATRGAPAPSQPGSDALLRLARTRVGDYWADRQEWARAIPYYVAAQCTEALAECYYALQAFDELAALIPTLPPNSLLLRSIGYKLQTVGAAEGAAAALLRAGDPKAAADCCVALNEWDRAVEISAAHELPQIEELLERYANRLLEAGNRISAVELYRRAGRDAAAARLLSSLAVETLHRGLQHVLAKQLFVLAALSTERDRERALSVAGQQPSQAAQADASAAVASLLSQDASALMLSSALPSSKGAQQGSSVRVKRDVAWHAAEAVHLLLLAQRQLSDGEALAAVVTSNRLPLFDDVLPARDTYALLALCAATAGAFSLASGALTRLRTAVVALPRERDAVMALEFRLFSRTRPVDEVEVQQVRRITPTLSFNTSGASLCSCVDVFDSPLGPHPSLSNQTRCPTAGCASPLSPWDSTCHSCGTCFPACVATGRPLYSTNGAWRCKRCHHWAERTAIVGRTSCPLCHERVSTT